MTLVVRLLTLLTIAAAGFAMPMTCAQGGVAAAAQPVAIEIQAAPRIESPPAGPAHLSEAQQAVRALAHRAFDQMPFDCGQTAPRVADPLATFDTQPFVPGYLESTLLLEEGSTVRFALPAVLTPIESRAGPPDAPPPKPID